MSFHRFEVFDSILDLRVGADGAWPSRRSGAAVGRHVAVDVVRSPGWWNESSELGIRFERDEAGIRRVVVDRPGVSGAFTSTARGLDGSFVVGGTGDALLEGLMGLGLAILSEERGDLLLHASAVADGDRAWLFLGEGGAGKTTIATELRGDRSTLCVDKALVSARPDGVLRVHATPFGDGLGAPPRSGSAAIAGLCFIEQADEHELVPLSRWEAINRLLGQAIAPARDAISVQRTMEMIGGLADLDAAFRLRFRKDAGFWPLIEDALSKG
jgi:hypothetical protein